MRLLLFYRPQPVKYVKYRIMNALIAISLLVNWQIDKRAFYKM
ncbi:hypothetical protein [Spirosoma sp. 209]|nr:hypothetical protein [Spirosoma sp. 209]